MHPNADLLRRFYEAFNDRDVDAMAAAYADNPHFRDPAFGDLYGSDVMAMWRMLVVGSTDLRVVARDISADDVSGRAHWTATYPFGATGRKVVNGVDATFAFNGGRITEHLDHFDFWRWSRQALGPVGLALGWTPVLRHKVRRQATERLRAFTASREGSSES